MRNLAGVGQILTEIQRVYIIPRLMQTPSFPEKIDPWRLCAEAGRLEGVLPLAALPRLAAALRDVDGKVDVALVAGVDTQGVRCIQGVLRTQVELLCQRCLEPLRWPLEVPVRLGLVHNEAEMSRLPEEYEPLLVAGNAVRVADLVEDELLLALPQIPRHADPAECPTPGYPATDNAPEQPLAALASLLRDLKRSA